MFAYILLIAIICVFSSCKESGPKEESATIEQGRIFTLNYGIFHTYLASDDWTTMNYGFDAIEDQSDAYVSIETNNKTNTFLLISAYNDIDKYSVKSDNNAIALTRGGVFTIPNPRGGGNLRAVRYTATSGASAGAEKLTVYRKMEIRNDEEVPLETLIGKDRDFWGTGWDDDDPFKNPITLDVKIYPQNILPVAYVYKLYGTSADISGVEAEINKILAQAVCKIQAVTLADTWPYADKGWDLNNNGKLDLWPNDPGNTGDEFSEIKEWARDLKQIWSDTKIGVAILEQAFEIHDNGGVEIHGISEENLVVLPGNVINRNFCHEYLHCDLAKDLKDINDEFNVMHYTDLFEQNRLRYRPVTIVTGAGGNERQWDILTGVSY